MINQNGNGIAQTLIPKEKPIVEKANVLVENGGRINSIRMKRRSFIIADEYVTEVYKSMYGI